MLCCARTSACALIACLLIGVVASGCTPLYRPTTPAVPLLEEARQLEAKAYFGAEGGHAQVGYAITEDYFVVAGGSHATSPETEYVKFARHGALEVGVGRQWTVENVLYGILGREFKLQAMGGAIRGRSSAQSQGCLFGLCPPNTRGDERGGTYWKPYLQTNYVRPTSRGRFGIVGRLSTVQFDTIENRTVPERSIDNPTTPIFLDAVTVFQMNVEDFGLETHLGVSWPVRGEPEFNFQPAVFSFGIGYRFSL